MPSVATPAPGTDDFSWYVTVRWQEFEGETRANVLRILSVVVFFAIELASYHGLSLGFLQFPPPREISAELHRAVTMVVTGWVLLAFGVHFCIQRQFLPAALKFVVSVCDIALLTTLLLLGTGPRSPLVGGYFVLITLAAQRFNLPLIRLTTVGCMLGYLIVCGSVRWYQKLDLQVPRYHQLMILAALGLTGIALGQVIRRVRSVAEEFLRRTKTHAASPTAPPRHPQSPLNPASVRET